MAPVGSRRTELENRRRAPAGTRRPPWHLAVLLVIVLILAQAGICVYQGEGLQAPIDNALRLVTIVIGHRTS
jgi:hypothetical protein